MAHIVNTGCRVQDLMDGLVELESARDFVHGFFSDFVERVYIADYSELRTRNHPLQYRGRAGDARTGRLQPKPIVDPREPGEAMNGNPLTRAVSPDGRWAYTAPYGWMWVSDEPFGWAVYHYGRWGFHWTIGWYWVPDTVWAPAWVVWRVSGDHVVWAPMPPRDRVRVTGWEPNKRLAIQHLGWVTGTGEMHLTPLGEDRTHLFWREELTPPRRLGALGALGLSAFKPLMSRIFRRDLRVLQSLVRARARLRA
jgi:hypothetical protein